MQPSFGIKDGLSLISSNAASVGLACLLLQDVRRVFDAHIGAAALSYEGFRASLDPLDPLASRLRPGPGQETSRRRSARCSKGAISRNKGLHGVFRIRSAYAACHRSPAPHCMR